MTGTKEQGLAPLGFGDDPNLLFVRAPHEGRSAIFAIDLNTSKMPRVLMSTDQGIDGFDGRLIYAPWLKTVVGIASQTHREALLGQANVAAPDSGQRSLAGPV